MGGEMAKIGSATIGNGESHRIAGGWSRVLVPQGPRAVANHEVAGHKGIKNQCVPQGALEKACWHDKPTAQRGNKKPP
jgi:hypothetical protein